MKRTNFLKSFVVKGLRVGLMVMMLVLIQGISSDLWAQNSSPLPTFKNKLSCNEIARVELSNYQSLLSAYQTKQTGDATFDRIMKMVNAYSELLQMMENNQMTVENSVTSIYPMLALAPSYGLQPTVNLTGFYTRNWTSEFSEIVSKLKI